MTGWSTTAELAGPRLQDALATCGASLRTDRPDIQGQRLVEVVAWLLALPVATALVEGTPLPDLRPENVELWVGDDPPDGNGLKLRDADADATHDGWTDAHLEPLIVAVNRATARPVSALWRSVKDRQDAAVAWIADSTGRRSRAFELLDGRAELRLLELGTGAVLLHVRKGCCLYYRTPAREHCFSCPLLDDDARRRLAAES